MPVPFQVDVVVVKAEVAEEAVDQAAEISTVVASGEHLPRLMKYADMEASRMPIVISPRDQTSVGGIPLIILHFIRSPWEMGTLSWEPWRR